MVDDNKKWGWKQRILAFFPLQLLLHHLKYNLLALLYWALIFCIVANQVGVSYGIPLLFFSPEYLGTVSVWSFLTIGFAIGGFTMGFHTYSYIKLAPQFSFLASLEHPFYKFCVNNSAIPIAFNIVYIYFFASFQIREEYASLTEVAYYVLAYLFGVVVFHLLSFMYFFPMNSRVTRSILDPLREKESENVAKTVIPNKEKWKGEKVKHPERQYLYIGKRFHLKTSRSNTHYSQELLTRIYEQNKINATIFETLSLISFITLGLFRHLPYFELPAAVSIVLLLTIILMLFSALISWLHRWTYPVLIVLFVAMDILSVKTDFFTFRNFAYGLKYEEDNKKPYSIEYLTDIGSNIKYQQESKEQLIEILEKWKAKTGLKKPKLVLLNVSGGGSRSAMWVLTCMQLLDQKLDQKLSTHTQMITGASGGMIGAAYFREIMHQHKKGNISNPYDPIYRAKISSDMLNRLAFAASTNDIFFRYQYTTIDSIKYSRDRGYAFETQLNKNTDSLLDVPLSYYVEPERNADVPLMIFSPTVVNDGRRMLIGSQTLSALTHGSDIDGPQGRSLENIDYLRYFDGLDPLRIRFTSVMRTSATFPFVMPMVTLPTEPEIQLMDAGIRDNYGGKVTMEYIQAVEDWIKDNTSGVVILQVRDTKKVLDNEIYNQVSFFDKITMPFGNMYKNFPRTQDFNQDLLIRLGRYHFDFPLDVVSFNLREKSKDKISLSWHLTADEKERIVDAIESRNNRHAYKRLKRLLDN